MTSEQGKPSITDAGLLSSLIAAGGQAALFVIAVVLARALGAEQYGVYSLAAAIAALAAILAMAGLPQLTMRDIARAHPDVSPSNRYDLTPLWRTLRAQSLVSTLVISCLLLLAATLFSQSSAQGELRQQALILSAWLVAPMVAIATLAATFRGLGKPVIGAGIATGFWPIAFLALFGVYAAISSGISPNETMIIRVLAVGALAAGALLWLIWHARSEQEDSQDQIEQRENAAPKDTLFQRIRAGLPFLLSTSAHLILSRSDIIILGIMREVKEAGVYVVATVAVAVLSVPIGGWGAVAGRRAAVPDDEKDLSALANQLSLDAAKPFAVCCVITALLALAGHDFVRLVFGDAYAGAALPMAVLAAGVSLSMAFGYANIVLAMRGEEHVLAKISVLAAFANIVLNLALIPSWGLMGAALATGLSLVFWRGACWFVVRRKIGMDVSVLSFLRVRSVGGGSARGQASSGSKDVEI